MFSKSEKISFIFTLSLEAGRTLCLKGGSQEELPHVRGQGQWPRVPDCDGAGTAERSYPASKSGAATRGVTPHPRSGAATRGVTPHPRSGAVAESARLRPHRKSREELPKSEVRGGSREDQPHVQGAVAAQAQEGLEELSHVEGQKGRR